MLHAYIACKIQYVRYGIFSFKFRINSLIKKKEKEYQKEVFMYIVNYSFFILYKSQENCS